MNNIVKIAGDQIDLCVYREDNEFINQCCTWINNSEYNHWVGHNQETIQIGSEREWVQSVVNSNKHAFCIVIKATGRAIGTCGIELLNHGITANLGIMIGEYQGEGYGTEAIKLLIKYAFEELNVHRVELDVAEDNIRAIKCYQKCGFKQCGIKHDWYYYHGEYHDRISMEILRQDYKKEE